LNDPHVCIGQLRTLRQPGGGRVGPKPASRVAKKVRQDLDLKARHTAPTSIG
jgi:hypothetical protein